VSAAGLRRFARPQPQQDTRPEPGAAAAAERCEMCGVPVDERHGHVVEVEKRSLVCTCRACYLLFTRDGAAGGRYRAVPERYLVDPAHPLTDPDWDELQIPVTTAFLFTNTAVGRVVACYPSPAGATECLLDLAAWHRLAGSHPLLSAAEPDVEALFVTRTDSGLESFLVPIDACYALVGAVRLHWTGFDGGDEVRRALASFTADLRARSRPLEKRSRPLDREV
jgi:Family of unknown function (DUF5947)